jgi:hypothetical protein
MTKEEILKKHFGDSNFEASDCELKSMDEYAKKEAIEFAKWCIKNDYWNHPKVSTFGT